MTGIHIPKPPAIMEWDWGCKFDRAIKVPKKLKKKKKALTTSVESSLILKF